MLQCLFCKNFFQMTLFWGTIQFITSDCCPIVLWEHQPNFLLFVTQMIESRVFLAPVSIHILG